VLFNHISRCSGIPWGFQSLIATFQQGLYGFQYLALIWGYRIISTTYIGNKNWVRYVTWWRRCRTFTIRWIVMLWVLMWKLWWTNLRQLKLFNDGSYSDTGRGYLDLFFLYFRCLIHIMCWLLRVMQPLCDFILDLLQLLNCVLRMWWLIQIANLASCVLSYVCLNGCFPKIFRPF
jgi:hypothetical protein